MVAEEDDIPGEAAEVFAAALAGAGTMRWSIAARADEVPVLRDAARRFAAMHGVPRPADVALGVAEAVANAVTHAYVADGVPGPVHLTAYLDDGQAFFVVADEGSGLIPRPEHPGAGLGLPLMARLSDSFEISESALRGTVVTLGFAIAVPPDGLHLVDP